MLAVRAFECLCHTDVVTCIKYYVLILVRQTNGDRELEALEAIATHIVRFINVLYIATLYASLIHIAIDANLLHYIETRLNTGLNSQTLNDIVLSHDRDVDLIKLYGSVTRKSPTTNEIIIFEIYAKHILQLSTLLRIKETSGNLKVLSYTIGSLYAYCETKTCLTVVKFGHICNVDTCLRHNAELANFILCVNTYNCHKHSSDNH